MLKDRLHAYVKAFEQGLENMARKEYFSVYVESSDYNRRSKSLSPKIIISVSADNILIHLSAQVNYYNITEDIIEDIHGVQELIKLNLLVIGYKAIEKFYEHLYAS